MAARARGHADGNRLALAGGADAWAHDCDAKGSWMRHDHLGRAFLSYSPNPIDTSRVTLPADLVTLTEQLAKSTHDLWALLRLRDGWRYGPHRDDFKKEHPALVPYEYLSEEEKQYDRAVAMETLRSIVALGYRIDRPETTSE